MTPKPSLAFSRQAAIADPSQIATDHAQHRY